MTDPAPTSTAIGKHPCPECGGDLEWNAARQALVCPYCGTIAPWSPAEAGDPGELIVENDLEAALRDPTASHKWDEEKVEVKCQSCHAISVFVGTRAAQRCDFCGSPAIIPQEAGADVISPASLLPFKISDGQIRDAIRAWYGSRWFAPNKLKRAALTDTLHGVYLPYWTFDAHVAARWTAEAGHYYYVDEVVTRNGRRETRRVRKVRWEPAAGRLEHFYDDLLVPATAGVQMNLLNAVAPFPTTEHLQAYSPEYVRGWTVERYQVDLRRAADLNFSEMEGRTRQLCSAEVPGDTQRNLQVDARYSGRTYKHILVPVWLVGYTYGSRKFQIIANGYTGKIAGEHPLSWIKITLAILAALVVVTLFVLYGQSQ